MNEIAYVPGGSAIGPSWQYRIEKDNQFTPWVAWSVDLEFVNGPDGNALVSGVDYWLHARSLQIPAYQAGSVESPLAVLFQIAPSGRVLAPDESAGGATIPGFQFAIKPSGNLVGAGNQYRISTKATSGNWVDYSAGMEFNQDPAGGALQTDRLYFLWTRNVNIPVVEDGSYDRPVVSSIVVSPDGQVHSGTPLGRSLSDQRLYELLSASDALFRLFAQRFFSLYPQLGYLPGGAILGAYPDFSRQRFSTEFKTEPKP